MWTINNSGWYSISNHGITNNQGKRILVLGDSYSWPITSYLAQDVEYISAFHPQYFVGDIKTYIEHYQPDLVLWIYEEDKPGAFIEMDYGTVE